jgi:NADPH-dependent 2,4-dienoyl-CoA reductase/sulfur reductase-like enzyme
MKKDVVIIGASDVGISAALRIRELDQSIKPLVIADNKFPNFSICGIPFFIGGEVKKSSNLAHRKEKDLKNAGMELLLETKVEKVVPDEKKIIAVNNKGTQEIYYDNLVLGTGGVNIEPAISGLELPEVFFMRWMDDAISFDNFIKENQPQKAAVIGGGYVGLEMADALKKRGLEVTVLEFMDSVLTTVNPRFRKLIKDKLENEGIEVILNTEVKNIEKIESGLKISGSNDLKLKVDTAVVSVGTKPNSFLAEGTELAINERGAFKVNKKMQTSIKDIYAGGDCAETLDFLTENYRYYALGTVAHKHGRIIGSNICGKESYFDGSIGTQSIKLFDQVISRTGLNEKEAEEAGFDPISTEITADDHKAYYPPAYKTYIKVIADKDSRQIIGAQILGSYHAEISKRIDIFAAAIYNQMTVEKFSQLDLSYTPPLSSPWDPVQKAVQQLELEF